MKIFEQRLNCTPPLLASETDKMCNERFNVTPDVSRHLFDLFVNNYINFEPSECKRPCTQTTYEIQAKAKAEQRIFMINLSFKPLVHVTRSMYSTTAVDAITSLGGSVRIYPYWN